MQHRGLRYALLAFVAFSPIFFLQAASLIDASFGPSELVYTSADADRAVGLKESTITRGQVYGEASAVPILSATLTTEEDLRLFAKGRLAAEPALKEISFLPDAVAVERNVAGKVFGLLPAEVAVKVTVTQEGKVTFGYPWYGSIGGEGRKAFESAMRKELAPVLEDESAAGWTNDDRARLVETIDRSMANWGYN